MNKVTILRVIHGFFALYFIICLIYLYYSVFFFKPNIFLAIALLSLGVEGFVVFILNKGDCPLIHIQRKLNDTTPFFELFLSKKAAKKAIPFFAVLTWAAVGLLIMKFIFY